MAHPACLARLAPTLQDMQGFSAWYRCMVCDADYRGPFARSVAFAWQARTARMPRECDERIESDAYFANLLGHEGKFEEAERMLLQVHDTCTRVHGADSDEAIEVARSLSKLVARRGMPADAVDVERRVHLVCESLHGPEHERTLVALESLGNTLAFVGLHKDAEDVWTKLLSIKTRLLGVGDLSTLTTAADLDMSLLAQGKPGGGASETLLFAQERAFGRLSLDALITMVNLGAGFLSQGRCQEASVVLRKAHARALREFGPSHSTTLYAKSLMDRCAGRAAPPKDCANPGCQLAGVRLCAGCMRAMYCGRECQKKHWKVHKPQCQCQPEATSAPAFQV